MSAWRNSLTHRVRLMKQADSLLDFYQFNSINPRGGFCELYDDGRPISDERQLHGTPV